jgi:ribosomal protein S19
VDDIPTKEEYELLMDTIVKSTYEPIPETAVKSHNREFTIPANLVGNLILVKNPMENCQTDIHNIQFSTILGE